MLGEQIAFGKHRLSTQHFEPVKNVIQGKVKPSGGLWSSTYRPNQEFLSDWHRICIEERWVFGLSQYAVTFKLIESARVYTINGQQDLIRLIRAYPGAEQTVAWDKTRLRHPHYEMLAKDWDAIHLTHDGLAATRAPKHYSTFQLKCWDVESTLLLNMDCVESWQPLRVENV